MRIYYAVILPGLVLLSGCATVARGSHEELRIASIPPGATVTADQDTGKAGPTLHTCEPTPCGIKLSRSYNAIVTVEMDGYQPIKYEVIKSGRSSKTLVKPGTVVAGVAPGSFVTVGEPKWADTLSGGTLRFVDASLWPVGWAMGAHNSLSPNPVTVTLAPEADEVEETNLEAAQEDKS